MTIRLLITLLVLWASVSSRADEKVFQYQCEGAEVEITGTFDPYDPGCLEFEHLRTKVRRGMRNVDIDLSSGFMHAACMNDAKRKAMIVFQQYCAGSGCNDGANYGIVDPRDLTVLLAPDPTSRYAEAKNRSAAAKILGLREPPHLFNDPATLCCSYCDD